VIVGDGTGQEVEIISNTEQLGRHCLAESAAEDPNPPPESGGVAPAAQGSGWLVTCRGILYTPVVSGNFVDGRTRFECLDMVPWADRTLTVRVAEVTTPLGIYKTKKNVKHYDDGRFGDWSPTLIASCRKSSNQTTKYVTWAREDYNEHPGGDTARRTSSKVDLQARCA
jgi:hypothetical protein